jgi:hypothetical protein
MRSSCLEEKEKNPSVQKGDKQKVCFNNADMEKHNVGLL